METNSRHGAPNKLPRQFSRALGQLGGHPRVVGGILGELHNVFRNRPRHARDAGVKRRSCRMQHPRSLQRVATGRGTPALCERNSDTARRAAPTMRGCQCARRRRIRCHGQRKKRRAMLGPANRTTMPANAMLPMCLARRMGVPSQKGARKARCVQLVDALCNLSRDQNSPGTSLRPAELDQRL